LIRFGNFILLAGALFSGNSQSTGCSGRASGSLSAQSLAGHPELGTQATNSQSTGSGRASAGSLSAQSLAGHPELGRHPSNLFRVQLC